MTTRFTERPAAVLESSRNDSVVRCNETMTTLCKCGCGRERRENSLYFSAACRKRVYEHSDKAQVRRGRYWATDKGAATRKRYQKTGATAAASRRYRERAAAWGRNLQSAVREYGLDHLKPEQVWTEEEIIELNIRSLWHWLGSSSMRVSVGKKRFDEFFRLLVQRQREIYNRRRS